jgi:hypothetical protein
MCAASKDAPGGGVSETVRYDNTTSSSVTLLIQVGSFDGLEDAFSIQAAISNIPQAPANDACAMPTMLTPGIQVTGTTSAATPSTSYMATPAVCTATATPKRDVYYSLVVPATKTATVVVTPTGAASATLDPFVNAFNSTLGCMNVAACFAGVDVGYDGEAETLTWTNTTGQSVTLTIQVGVWFDLEGDFTILATVP